MTDEPPPRGTRDDDLADLVEELSATLETLQREVEGDRRRGPLDRPTPPSPPGARDLLRFTEEYTIPTLIALLESGVRSLELLQATLRLVDGRGVREPSGATRERVESVGGAALSRVDDVLADLQSAIEGGEPSDPDARELLSEARGLREDIDRRLREGEAAMRDRDGPDRPPSGRTRGDGRDIPVSPAEAADEPGESGEAEGDVAVDVEAELESIRREMTPEEDETDGVGPDDGD